MSMLFKGVPIPVLVALGVLIFGGLLHIIGLATPNWHEITFTTTVVKNQAYGHHGLWVGCSFRTSDVVDCQSHGDGSSDVEGFIVAVRALEVLALMFGVACVVVTGLWFFLNIQKHRLIMMISALGTGFTAGLFGLIGIIVYAAEINSKTSTSPGTLFTFTLSWSFALCVLSSCLVTIATILIAVGSRLTK